MEQRLAPAEPIYDAAHLARNPANFTALTPLGFLARAAATYPDKIAVIDGARHFTYREFYARCCRFADALRRRGIASGDTVAVMAPNVPALLEAHYGVPMAGAVLNALNYRLDARSIAFILAHGAPRLLITDREFAPLASEALRELGRDIAVVEIDDGVTASALGGVDYEDFLAEGDMAAPWSPPADEWAAITLNYTSGTTGNPKGALYSHRSTLLHTFAIALPDALNLSARDTILPVVPMFHVNAWGLPYAAAMVGSKMVMPGAALDGKSLYELFENEKVSLSAGVPTVWQGLLTYTESNNLKFSTMNRTVIGGSACPPAMIKLFQEKYGVQVLHAWGMTEMSPVGTVGTLKAKEFELPPAQRQAVQHKQGRAIFGVDFKIIGDDGAELPWDGNAFGDLLVRGPWVIREYFKGEGGNPLHGGWFPTGDVSNIDARGYMQITDRSKDVIKSGGEWISSIDIENVAMSHPAVAMAACIAARHPKWDERPLLVVVKKPGVDVTREQILAHFEGKVAKWQVPDDVVFTDSIPLGATGKMLKAKLREQFKDYRLPTA